MGFFDEDIIYSYKNNELFDEPVPMDVLIDLCRKGKVAFRDIFISDITHQYLDYVAGLEEKDYDNISSFILFAGTLLELKSSSLLPKVEEDVLEEEGMSDDDYFQMRLEEYDILRDACEKMKPNEILNRFYRDPLYDENDFNVIIKNYNLDKMITAFTLMMEKIEFTDDPKIPKTIIKERFTVADRVREIVEIVRALKIVNFTTLFEPDYSKMEKVNTFLALLELLKEQVVTVEQAEPCGEIVIRHSPLTDKFNAEEVLEDVDTYD